MMIGSILKALQIPGVLNPRESDTEIEEIHDSTEDQETGFSYVLPVSILSVLVLSLFLFYVIRKK